MQVFMRAYKSKDMHKEEVVDILTPIDSFNVTITGETCVLRVGLGGSYFVYYMSERQYNFLLLALKRTLASGASGFYLDGSC